MEIILTNYSMIFLTVAVVLRLFNTNLKASLASYGCALGIALGQNYVEPIGFVFILIAIAVLQIHNQKNLDNLIKAALWIFLLVFGFNLLGHKLTGFNNMEVIYEKPSQPAVYYNLWINYDSLFFGVALFIFKYEKISFEYLKRTLMLGILSAVMVIPIIAVLASRYELLSYEYFIPEYLLYWVWIAALYALVAESFYRMFIIDSVIGNRPYNLTKLALIIIFSSALYALQPVLEMSEHIKVNFIVGLLYSLVYVYSGKRVEASFLVHFLVSMIHMFFFTYSVFGS